MTGEPPAERGDGPGATGASVLDDIRRPLELTGRYMATASVLFMTVYAIAIVLVIESGQFGGEARQLDFVAFWGAGKLALAGDAVAAFDRATLRSVQELPPDTSPVVMNWLYPPAMQYLFALFALLPYWVAWLGFNLLSIGLFARAIWRPAAAVPAGHDVVIGGPAIIISFRLGQVSILWTGVLVLALDALFRRRTALAGVMIGLLSLKPQLGILIPLVLIARGAWGVMLWAAVTAVLVHGVPTLFVGLEYWVVFFENIQDSSAAMAVGGTRQELMVSPYALCRLFGAGHDAALGAQFAVTAALAAALVVAWRRKTANCDLLAGLLIVAIPVASHYAFFYELVLCLPAVILLVRGGFGAALFDRVLLGLAVIWPAAFFISPEVAPLTALMLLAIFVRVFLLVIRGGGRPAAPAPVST